jgi:hypothetical protein
MKVANDVIPAPLLLSFQCLLFCHPSVRRWDPGYYFSNKYLRNLLNREKGKEALVNISFKTLASFKS